MVMSLLNSAFRDLKSTPRMPALFVGHGNPMNAIEDNVYSREWRAVGDALPVPSAILVVSAHWMTHGTTLVNVKNRPQTIHDFGGFPSILYEQQYPAPGSPEFALATIDLVQKSHLEADEEWGLDHGAWSVLIKMFPKADIPVYQLSLDLTKSFDAHFELAQELSALREKGVMIIGSGNIVHNLRTMRTDAKAYDWAETFDAYITRQLESRDFVSLKTIETLGELTRLAHPTLEHYLPMLYVAGVAHEKEPLRFFNTSFDLASISMRSFIFA
jgi:4,5-DOPA dioxygenase extradiol